jgi:hypothetical protein
MHLFFYYANNKNMKKIILICFLLFEKVYAINNITIDNDELSPKFSSNIKVYNYFTNKDKVKIKLDDKIEELYLDKNKNSFIFDGYKVNIFKNYYKDNNEEVYLTNVSIIGHKIDFNQNNHNYYIEIENEDILSIDYELSNDNAYVSVIGNGNFNKVDNIITISINNKYNYLIHVHKNNNILKRNSIKKDKIVIKKEIALFIIITFSCILVFLYAYYIFI